MPGDDPTSVRAEHRPGSQDVALLLVVDGAGRVPTVGQRRQHRLLDQVDDRPPPQTGAAQISHAGDAVSVGRVHPVVHADSLAEPRLIEPTLPCFCGQLAPPSGSTRSQASWLTIFW